MIIYYVLLYYFLNNNQTEKQTNKQTDIQADRQTDRQTDRQNKNEQKNWIRKVRWSSLGCKENDDCVFLCQYFTDICREITNCKACITQNPTCAWCTDPVSALLIVYPSYLMFLKQSDLYFG